MKVVELLSYIYLLLLYETHFLKFLLVLFQDYDVHYAHILCLSLYRLDIEIHIT